VWQNTTEIEVFNVTYSTIAYHINTNSYKKNSYIPKTGNLDYTGSVRCLHVLALQIRMVTCCSADAATRAALPQNEAETLIGSPNLKEQIK